MVKNKKYKHMKTKNIIILLITVFFSITVYSENKKITKLSKPILIQGKNKSIKLKGAGYAHPAVYDWNQDGKKDLIIGEFSEKSTFRVYLNIGTDAEPKFSGEYFYGKDVDAQLLFVESC
jgi:hypothetical protein